MLILKLNPSQGMRYSRLNISDFLSQKNFNLHDNFTSIQHFLTYKTKSAYELFSTIPICKSAFKLIHRKSSAVHLTTDLQTKSLIKFKF